MSRALPLALALALAPVAFAAESPAEVASTYQLATNGSTQSLKVGREGTLRVAFKPLAAGVHLDPQAPLKIRVETSSGLKAVKGELRRSDAVDPRAENLQFEVPIAAVSAGSQEARLVMDFFVCSDRWCAKQARVLRFPVTVK